MKFNINDYVTIKLTADGKKVVAEENERLTAMLEGTSVAGHVFYDVQEDDTLKIQLWKAFQLFGPKIEHHSLLFHTTVELDTKNEDVFPLGSPKNPILVSDAKSITGGYHLECCCGQFISQTRCANKKHYRMKECPGPPTVNLNACPRVTDKNDSARYVEKERARAKADTFVDTGRYNVGERTSE